VTVSPRVRRLVLWGSQVLLAAVLVWFVARAIHDQWATFRTLSVTLRPKPELLVAAMITVLATYAVLIGVWRGIVIAWGERLSYRDAVRIWCLSNLGRYLPGKVWSVAGLAVLARRTGVSAWAATGSAVVTQAVAVGTGVSVVALAAPTSLSPPAIALAAAVAVAVVLVVVDGRLPRWALRVAGSETALTRLPPGAVLLAAGATLVSWMTYGVGFWLVARGLLGADTLGIREAIGIFAAGYLAGLIALFAPGGVGVREAVYLAMLAPHVGGGGAVALAVGSRLLLTLTEIMSAALAAALRTTKREIHGDPPGT